MLVGLLTYKAWNPNSSFLDKLIGLFTCSKYSHTEIIFQKRLMYSSSFMDGGYRKKVVKNLNNWEYIELEVTPKEVLDMMKYADKLLLNPPKYNIYKALLSGISYTMHLSGTYCSQTCIDIIKSSTDKYKFKDTNYTPDELYHSIKIQTNQLKYHKLLEY